MNLIGATAIPRGLRRLDRARTRWAFTIIEVMIAISIFMMVMAAIYSTWLAVLRSTQASLKAAAHAQRSRVAVRTLQDALLSAVNHQANLRDYSFTSDVSTDFANIEFSARLPASFPGVGRFGGSIVRRVQFLVERADHGKDELVLYQRPLLLAEEQHDFRGHRLVLSPDVSIFRVHFLEAQTGKWEQEWKTTNSLPKLMRLELGLGRKDGGDEPADLTSTILAIPGNPVTPDLQSPFRPGVP